MGAPGGGAKGKRASFSPAPRASALPFPSPCHSAAFLFHTQAHAHHRAFALIAPSGSLLLQILLKLIHHFLRSLLHPLVGVPAPSAPYNLHTLVLRACCALLHVLFVSDPGHQSISPTGQAGICQVIWLFGGYPTNKPNTEPFPSWDSCNAIGASTPWIFSDRCREKLGILCTLPQCAQSGPIDTVLRGTLKALGR